MGGIALRVKGRAIMEPQLIFKIIQMNKMMLNKKITWEKLSRSLMVLERWKQMIPKMLRIKKPPNMIWMLILLLPKI